MAEFVLESRKFIVDGSGIPLNESTMTAFETQVGTKLPTQLRSFYLRWNGGLPCPEDIPEDKGICVRVYWKSGVEAARGGAVASFENMFRINAEPSSDFLRTWKDFKHRLPQDVLCFARNPGSSLFLIGLRTITWAKSIIGLALTKRTLMKVKCLVTTTLQMWPTPLSSFCWRYVKNPIRENR
jgi:hypothetical protein